MRRTITAAAIGIALLGGAVTACSCDPWANTSPAVEVEDCDAEDFANREADCGFADADRRKTPAPKTPAPKRTRR